MDMQYQCNTYLPLWCWRKKKKKKEGKKEEEKRRKKERKRFPPQVGSTFAATLCSFVAGLVLRLGSATLVRLYHFAHVVPRTPLPQHRLHPTFVRLSTRFTHVVAGCTSGHIPRPYSIAALIYPSIVHYVLNIPLHTRCSSPTFYAYALHTHTHSPPHLRIYRT